MRPYSLVAVLLLLSGCWGTPTVNSLSDADAWVIPVVPARIEATSSKGQGAREEPEMIITVPASEKPTKIEVRRVKRSVMDKVLTNKPAHEVKADNPGVVANQPKQTVWWRWIVALIFGLFIVAAVVMAIVNKLTSWSPWGVFKKLFRRS